MKYAVLAIVIWAGPLVAQDKKVSDQSLKATISNLETEPAPYVPDDFLAKSAENKKVAARIDKEQADRAQHGAELNRYERHLENLYRAHIQAWRNVTGR